MVKSSGCALVASRPDGGPILPSDFAAGLGTDCSMLQSFGNGGRWQSAGFSVYELTREPFLHLEEPSEAFFESQRLALIQFASWLENVDAVALRDFRNKGNRVRVIVEMVIEDDQMELELPGEVLAQLGRLNIPLLVSTDSI